MAVTQTVGLRRWIIMTTRTIVGLLSINKKGMMVLAIVLLKFQRTKDGTKGAHMSNLLMVMTSDS